VPELPEVEVVRRGLERWLLGAGITQVDIRHERSVRRHLPGPQDLVARLCGTRVREVARRGKFLWLVLDSGEALVAHLGMSGQLLLQPGTAAEESHLRVRLHLVDAGEAQLRFVDQRMFGGLAVEPLLPTPDGLPGGAGTALPALPVPVAHIARDALDPHLDVRRLLERVRGRRSGIKRVLLDQTVVSGIGNIYADEALWRVGLHYDRPASALGRPAVLRLFAAVREVMTAALSAGGTSFDSLYVNVNGRSGSFDRELAVYGRAGRPCPRCGTEVRRDAFMNRSSFTCPRCQLRPRGPRRPAAGAADR
jgi:formamidopyrimidine-DNA glycosylase